MSATNPTQPTDVNALAPRAAGTDQAIIDAAVDVAVFSKTNLWPAESSPEFFEFARRLDVLATAINRRYPHFNANIAKSAQQAGWKVVLP